MEYNSPADRRHAETRARLIALAMETVKREGASGLSIRSLADQINYSPGAVYTYFENKEALIDAVRAEFFRELNDLLRKKTSGFVDPEEMLVAAGMAYVEYARENPNTYQLLFLTEPGDSTRGDHRKAAMSALISILELGINSGRFRERPGYALETMALHCWSTVHGLAMLQTSILKDDGEEAYGQVLQVVRAVTTWLMTDLRTIDGVSPERSDL